MNAQDTHLAQVSLLMNLRRNFKLLATDEERRGFRKSACWTLAFIEVVACADALWTSLPDESELTPSHRIGDHLAVTRRTLGFLS